MLPKNVPLIDLAIYKASPKLSGLFLVTAGFSIKTEYLFKNSYVYLKNGLLHNEDGPALILMEERILWYYNRGKLTTLPIPFSALNYSHPTHPSYVTIKSSPTWNGSQFTFNTNDVLGYDFYDDQRRYHNLSGPAVVADIGDNRVRTEYFLHGENMEPLEYAKEVLAHNKLQVLKIIQNS